ncbi:uncharacterized protein CYBJADRAFT_168135 [Cyberlindnera jadinii NRRL Y-1542]|uniref:Uncharacterized protein n=1 Tax=Cyberlindnera jadinii (strain ATCC 18201 / CBS 1600 / BCRC 20928 / JCM 3617 / NBRC 0987 / NRRL Y-1542) TaxID=983966 RepID=A0A1E4S0Q8_CYBJN|nr:hypothetical protein CYBJADRAFT_168135 [Cyberlindnera jadinii NRRL Y-1542]ODV73073.1 hypothetical protein CYBJADRAFT_168135 [Cyberlindnera jadinii NRRL Y-1542]
MGPGGSPRYIICRRMCLSSLVLFSSQQVPSPPNSIGQFSVDARLFLGQPWTRWTETAPTLTTNVYQILDCTPTGGRLYLDAGEIVQTV